MSASGEISRISGNVTAALAAVANKGGTVPANAVSDDLATAIASIPGAPSFTLIDKIWFGEKTFTSTTNANSNNITVKHDLGAVPDKCLVFPENFIPLNVGYDYNIWGAVGQTASASTSTKKTFFFTYKGLYGTTGTATSAADWTSTSINLKVSSSDRIYFQAGTYIIIAFTLK